MIFFYRPTCSYRFMFFYRVETSAPGLSGHYWYSSRFLDLPLEVSIEINRQGSHCAGSAKSVKWEAIAARRGSGPEPVVAMSRTRVGDCSPIRHCAL